MHNVLHTAHKQQMHIEWAPTEEKSRLLWPLYILVCVIQCVCQLHTHTHTHTHTNSYNTTHTYTQIYMTSLMVKHMLTHRYMPILGFSRLLLSYTCPLSSNTFCFILLPESSLSVQETQDPKKKEQTLVAWGPLQSLMSFLQVQNHAQGYLLFSILKGHWREFTPVPDWS